MKKNIIAGVLTVVFMASFVGLGVLIRAYPLQVLTVAYSVIIPIIFYLIFKIIKSKL